MNDLLINISTIPFLLILFFIFKKMGIIKKEWAKPLSFIGFNLGLSLLIFLSFLQAPIAKNTLLNPFIGFLFASLLFLIGFIFIKFFKIPKDHKPIFISSLVTREGGGVGYPFFIVIFGVLNLTQIALFDLGMAIFAFTILTFYFYRSTTGTKKELGGQIIKILKIPILPAMVIGLILNLLGLRMSGDGIIEGSIMRLIQTLSAVAIPLILMSIVLNFEINIKAIKKALPFSVGSIAISVVLASILFFVWRFIPLNPLAKGALLVMALLPPSLYVSALAENLNLSDDKKNYATQLFSVTVFISIIILLILSPFIPKIITLW